MRAFRSAATSLVLGVIVLISAGCPSDEWTIERVSKTWVSVAASDEHSCALAEDGEIRCWGCGYESSSDPRPFGWCSPPPGAFTDVAVGMFHTCGLRDDGEPSAGAIGASTGSARHWMDRLSSSRRGGTTHADWGPTVVCAAGDAAPLVSSRRPTMGSVLPRTRRSSRSSRHTTGPAGCATMVAFAAGAPTSSRRSQRISRSRRSASRRIRAQPVDCRAAARSCAGAPTRKSPNPSSSTSPTMASSRPEMPPRRSPYPLNPGFHVAIECSSSCSQT